MGQKLEGGLCPFGEEELGSHQTQCGQGEANPHANLHLDPSNRLATVHERHRQDRKDNGPIAQGEPFLGDPL